MDLDPEKVTALVDKWACRLGVGPEWSLGIKVIKDRDIVDEEDRDKCAYTIVKAPYYSADITFHEWQFDDEELLDLVACHEVLHIVLHQSECLVANALGEQNENIAEIITENAVEIISRALVRLQNASSLH